MRTVFAFCFVLVSCKRQAGKIERLYWCLVQQKTLQTLQGSAINKIPNIPQCTLPLRPMCPDPPFRFFEGLVPRLVASGHFSRGRDVLCEFDDCLLAIGSRYASNKGMPAV